MNAQITNQQQNSIRSLVFLVIYFLALLILQPFLWGMVETRALALHERRTLTEQIKETEIRNREIRNKYESQSIYIEQLASVIPGSSDALQVIERLETATQGLDVQVEVSRIDEGTSIKSIIGKDTKLNVEGGITIEETMAVSGEKVSKIFPLYITLIVTGPPEALIDYIDAVEHVQELSMIQKFTLSPRVPKIGQDVQLDQRDFQLLMTAVFYLQNESDGKE